MKRIKVLCGICKDTKIYSVLRGVKKVSSIITCENCRHFYQKLKTNPFSLDCISPIKGSCFKACSFMKTRCKGCWAMQVLDSCPHPKFLYSSLSLWLSEECRKQIRGSPLELNDVKPEDRGKVTLEMFDKGGWIEASEAEKDLLQLQIDNDEEEEKEEQRKEEEKEEQRKEKEEIPETIKNVTAAAPTTNDSSPKDSPRLSMAELSLEGEEEGDLEEDEANVDDPMEMDAEKEVATPRLPPRKAKMSERIKRRRKRVEYFTKPVVGRKAKGPIHGPDGKISKSGIDLCDCLQTDCYGCHFPCPKCRSPKCGNECRVNRRWYYERVEVEGTKIFWVNKYAPKL